MALEALFPSTSSNRVTTKDMVLTFLVWVFVVVFWCGSWRLAEEYFLKGEDYYTSWIVSPVAAAVCVIITCIKPLLEMLFRDKEESWVYIIFTRFFTYMFTVVYIIQWVAVWNLMNIYHGKGWENSLWWLLICFALSWLFGVSRTALRSPYFIRLDARPEFFKVHSRFRCIPEFVVCFLLDVMCTYYIFLVLIIGIWRGFWNILSDVVFPDEPLGSYMFCLFVGLLVLIVMGMLQYLVAKLSEKLDEDNTLLNKLLKLVVEDLYHAVIILGTIMAWRGLWMIIEAYIFTDDLFGGWMCHSLGFFFLVLLRTSSTVMGKEIDIDGSDKEGKGVLWKVEYTDFYNRQAKDEDYIKISWI